MASNDPRPVALEEPRPEAAVGADAAMWAVVLAGGIGSRFWPLSTPERPKQVLSLVGDKPLIADTVARLAPLVPPTRVLVLTSRDIAPAIHAAIPELPPENLLVEPRPLGTAAAVARGAHEIARRAGPEAVACVVHADLAVGFPESFRDALRRAAVLAAAESVLVILGATPTRADTGFGYLVPGDPLAGEADVRRGGACWVSQFIEKPEPAHAQALIALGGLWHAGVVVARASVLLEGLAEHTREVAPALAALEAGDLETFARAVRSASLERGLLERSERVVVVPVDCMWDDVGTWACLRRSRELDDTGNGASGPAYFVDASSNVVHTENGPVVLYGVSQLLVVALDGITFVTTLERARDLHPLLDALPASMRTRPTGG